MYLVWIFILLLAINYIRQNNIKRNYIRQQVRQKIIDRNKSIPKILWTYWHTGYLPKVIQDCIKTWKKHNNDYVVVVLNKTTLKEYLPDINIYSYKHATSQQKIADFIRLEILERYGGFWLDASIIITESLEWIRNKGSFVGYYLESFTSNPRYPVIENWFFGCIPGHPLLSAWNKEFKRMNQFYTIEDYVNDLRTTTYFWNINHNLLTYLTCHLALQKVIQEGCLSGSLKENIFIGTFSKGTCNAKVGDIYSSSVVLFKAEDGPYKYLYKNNWDSIRSLDALKNDWSNHCSSIIKLRSSERNLINYRKINLYNSNKCGSS